MDEVEGVIGALQSLLGFEQGEQIALAPLDSGRDRAEGGVGE
jgi:hypothetical protein